MSADQTMASNIDYTKPVYCLITGASRGIGRTIAIETAKRATDKLTLVLLARSEGDLNKTKKLIEKIKPDAKILVFSLDLSEPKIEQYETIIKDSLKDTEIQSALIFHNAGQIGHLKMVVNLPDVSIWQNYFTLNLFSVTALNSVFVHQLRKYTKNLTVINITSLFGRQPGKYVGLYATGKAARDMYFKVLAEEEPDIKVLNWSPGMVQTDMALNFLVQMDSIEGTNEKDNIIKKVLTAEQTIGKMFGVLEKNVFKSGDIIDYYDDE